MSNDKPDGYVFGRPTHYRKEMIDEVVPLMSKGYSKEALAGHLGISKDTLYEYIKKYPDFADAIKRGEVASQLFWEGLGIQGIILGRSENFAQGAWAFNMKARFKWTETQKIESNQEIKLKYSLDESEDGEEE